MSPQGGQAVVAAAARLRADDGPDGGRPVALPAAILASMHIGFLGFGLIGGSIARAVRATPDHASWTMTAWSPTGDGPRRAVADGTLSAWAESPMAAIAEADLVVLAGPPTACLGSLDGLAGPWRGSLRPDAVVTDVASTKSVLVAHADRLGLRFVGGHPMAGRELVGYAAAQADLFVDRPWVLVPGTIAQAADIDLVESLALACGGRVVRMDAETHDRAVAGISHLPLVVAAALALAVVRTGASDDWPVAAQLAAGGWRDMTRLARGDVAMGAGIAATNAPAIAARLRDLRAELEEWLAELERPGGPDEEALAERLQRARTVLEAS